MCAHFRRRRYNLANYQHPANYPSLNRGTLGGSRYTWGLRSECQLQLWSQWPTSASSCSTWTSKKAKNNGPISKTESIGSIGSSILAILEVQVQAEGVVQHLVHGGQRGLRVPGRREALPGPLGRGRGEHDHLCVRGRGHRHGFPQRVFDTKIAKYRLIMQALPMYKVEIFVYVLRWVAYSARPLVQSHSLEECCPYHSAPHLRCRL